ncbi:MAG TPA: trypsin-like peptidase domain-containing protein [Acidimicrobiales bacterium]|jgi:S1-C subfamily serine protease
MSKRAIVAVVLLFALLSSGIGVAIGASLANSHGGTTATSFPTAAPSPSSSDSNSSSSSGSQSQALPAPSNGSSSGSLSTDDIAKKVDTSLVDINVTFSAGEGAGTGMILTSNGLVLTNNHVIANATKIEVQSVDSGDTYSASVLGYDITDDVALIQLKDASGLTPVSVGNSDKLSAGDDVVALGNALGKGGTPSVAEGTVSALDQSIQVQDDNGTTSTLAGLIETSAQLQPGDSGGAMVDSTGTVIGMNAAASTSRRGRTTNDSFAIPINSALDIAKNIENGQGSSNIHIGDRALLGVQIQGDSPTVADVESGSPADKAGIQAGDTITNVDGTSINSATDIVSALDSHHPGDGVKVTWTDGNGNQQTATVQLESGPPA